MCAAAKLDDCWSVDGEDRKAQSVITKDASAAKCKPGVGREKRTAIQLTGRASEMANIREVVS